MKTKTITRNRIKDPRQDIVLRVICYIAVLLAVVATLFPFLNVVSKAFSSESAVIAGRVTFLPVEFQVGTLGSIMKSPVFQNSFKVSVIITILGTILSLLITVVTAYPLSKKHLPFIKPILVFFVFTMLFSGGMIPTYLLVRNLGLINNIFALILPIMLSVYNMLIVKNYYEGLPESLEEAAKIDGASNPTILLRIILPLSTPVIATIGMFYLVMYWNDYFNAMIYITDPDLKPLQLYLREMILESSQMANSLQMNVDDEMNASPEGVRSAAVVAVTVPILIVYPFVQKYFVKGITMGSVKG